MLPASRIADCSSTPRSFDEPAGRRSISSERRIAVGFGKTSSVLPVRSPSMCIMTAATGSSGPEICGGTSSRRAMFSIGTLIMIVCPVMVDSAVAACPAPMLATSRSASSCVAVKDRISSIGAPLEYTAHVDDEGGRSVAEDRRPAEHRHAFANAVELLHHDLLLARQLVDDEAGAPLRLLEHDHLLAAPPVGRRQLHQRPQPDEWKHLVTKHEHIL